jgi:hypothetical protein
MLDVLLGTTRSSHQTDCEAHEPEARARTDEIPFLSSLTLRVGVEKVIFANFQSAETGPNIQLSYPKTGFHASVGGGGLVEKAQEV